MQFILFQSILDLKHRAIVDLNEKESNTCYNTGEKNKTHTTSSTEDLIQEHNAYFGWAIRSAKNRFEGYKLRSSKENGKWQKLLDIVSAENLEA